MSRQPQVIRGESQSDRQAQFQQAAQGFAGVTMQHREQEHQIRMDNLANEWDMLEIGVAQYDGDVASFVKANPEMARSFLGHLYDGDKKKIAHAFRNLSEMPATAAQVAAGAASSKARGDTLGMANSLLGTPEEVVEGLRQGMPVGIRAPGPGDGVPWRQEEGQVPSAETLGPITPDGPQVEREPEGESSGFDAFYPPGGPPETEDNVYEPPSNAADAESQIRELGELVESLRRTNPEEAARAQQYEEEMRAYAESLYQYEKDYADYEVATQGRNSERVTVEIARLRERNAELGRALDNPTNFHQAEALAGQRQEVRDRLADLAELGEQASSIAQSPPRVPEPPKPFSISPTANRPSPSAPNNAEELTAEQRQGIEQQRDRRPAWDNTQGSQNEFDRRLGENTTVLGGIRDAWNAIPEVPEDHFTRDKGQTQSDQPVSGRDVLESISIPEPEDITTPQEESQAVQRRARDTSQGIISGENPTINTEDRPYLANFYIRGEMTDRQAREFQRDTAQDMRGVRREFRVNPELKEGTVLHDIAVRSSRVLTELHNPDRAAIWDAIEPPAMAAEREARFRRQLDTERLDFEIEHGIARNNIELGKLELADKDFAWRVQQAQLAMEAGAKELPPHLQNHWDYHASIQQTLLNKLIEDYGDNPDRLQREYDKLITRPIWKSSEAARQEMAELMGYGPEIIQTLRDGNWIQRLFGMEPETGARERTPEERPPRTLLHTEGQEPQAPGVVRSAGELYIRDLNSGR